MSKEERVEHRFVFFKGDENMLYSIVVLHDVMSQNHTNKK